MATIPTTPQQDQAPDASNIQLPQSQPNFPATQQPQVVQQPQRTGLAGIIDQFREAIAPSTQHVVTTDAQGNKTLSTVPSTGLQRWGPVVANLVRGAGAGMAAGQGAGNQFKSIQAGFNAGERQAKDARDHENGMVNEVAKNKQDKMDTIKQQHDLAVQNFKMAGMHMQLNDELRGHYQDALDKELKPVDQGGYGSVDAGFFKDENSLADIQKDHPDFWKRVYTADPNADSDVRTYPEYDADGKVLGMRVVLRTQDVSKQLAPDGTTFKVFVPGKDANDPGKLEDQKPSGILTNGQIERYNNAAIQKYNAAQMLLAKKNDVDAQAQQRKDQGQAALNKSTQVKGGKGASGGGAAAPENEDALIDSIGQGKVKPNELGRMLQRDPQLAEKITQKYPDFDTTKVNSYAQVHRAFTSGREAQQLTSGDAVLQHLKELKDMNTVESHIPGTPDWNAYQNHLNTVAHELAGFYGHVTDQSVQGYKSKLGSNLPGTRDSAIHDQAHTMGDRLDAMKKRYTDAAPSKFYQAEFPDISDKGKEARAALDPAYRNRIVAGQVANNQQQQNLQQGGQPAVKLNTGEVPYVNPTTKQQIVIRNNKWVDVQTGKPV